MTSITLHVSDRHIDRYLKYSGSGCSIELAAAEIGLILSVGTRQIIDNHNSEIELPQHVTDWINSLDRYVACRGSSFNHPRPYPLTFTIEIPDAKE